jgi:hypothetical protein
LRGRNVVEASADDLVAFARDGLAAFKVPRHARFVTEWPMEE